MLTAVQFNDIQSSNIRNVIVMGLITHLNHPPVIKQILCIPSNVILKGHDIWDCLHILILL